MNDMKIFSIGKIENNERIVCIKLEESGRFDWESEFNF